MNDDLDLLASAHLDGELDDVARADADRDPAVAARVAELRAARDAVAAVDAADPPSSATRSRVLAAALAAYDELHAAPDAAAAAVAGHAPPRPARASRSRWLGAVAAATVVAAGIGVVVASVATDEDEDSTGISDAAIVVTDDGSEDRVQDDTAPAAADAEDAAGAAEPADELTAATAATMAAADTMIEATESSEAATAVVVTLVGTGELAVFVEELAARPAPDVDVEPDVTVCDDDRFERPIASVRYASDAESPPRDAVVVLDAAGTTAAALDASTCEVLAEVTFDRQD
jgi:hypothetical protein